MAVTTVVICLLVCWWAYASSRRAALDAAADENLALSRTIVQLVEHDLKDPGAGTAAAGNEAAAINDVQPVDRSVKRIAEIWRHTDPPYPGSFVSVIDARGRLALHTRSPQRRGVDVSQLVIDPDAASPRPVTELLATKQSLAAWNLDAEGNSQLVGYAYSPATDSLVAVHVPLKSIEHRIRDAALPWVLALVFLGGVLIPVLVSLLHHAYAKRQRDVLQRSRSLVAREQQLQRQFAELELLYRTAPVGLCVVDTDLRFIRINDELAALGGLPAEQHIGRSLRDTLHGLADPLEPICRRAMKSGKPELRTTVEQADPMICSEQVKFLVSVFPVKDDTGQVVGVSTVVQDISSESLAAKKLRLTQFSVDSCSTAIFWLREDARFVYANEAAASTFGYSRDQFLSMSVHDIDPAYSAEVWPDYWQSMQRRRSLTFESRIRHQDGTLVPVVITTNLLEFEGQEFVFAFVTDITKRKKFEQTLSFQADVLNRVSDAVLVTSRDGIVTYANEAAGQLLLPDNGQLPQRDHGKLHGRNFAQLHDQLNVAGPNSNEILASLAETGTWQGENDYLVAGDVRSVESRVKTFQPPDSDEFIVSVARDISLRKKTEQERRQQLDTLAHVTRLSTMGEMVAGIAHEVKQPLHAIANYASAASICLDQADPVHPLRSDQIDNLKECNAGVQDASQRANEIIQGLRAFAQKSEKRREKIDLNQVIAGSIDLVAFESRESRITVETELADHLPEVLADRIQIEQVLVNLLHNAYEALRRVDDARQVVVRSLDAKSEVEIQVQDSGPGIAFDHYAKLFEAFYTTKKNGLGMGLTISRTIIEDHGGRLWAHTNSDAGMTFHFSLPTVRTGANRSKE